MICVGCSTTTSSVKTSLRCPGVPPPIFYAWYSTHLALSDWVSHSLASLTQSAVHPSLVPPPRITAARCRSVPLLPTHVSAPRSATVCQTHHIASVNYNANQYATAAVSITAFRLSPVWYSSLKVVRTQLCSQHISEPPHHFTDTLLILT